MTFPTRLAFGRTTITMLTIGLAEQTQPEIVLRVVRRAWGLTLARTARLFWPSSPCCDVLLGLRSLTSTRAPLIIEYRRGNRSDA